MGCGYLFVERGDVQDDGGGVSLLVRMNEVGLGGLLMKMRMLRYRV